MIRKMTNIIAALVTVVIAGSIGYGLISQANADEQSTGSPQVVRVEYNVRGTDTASNAYLESVQVKNTTGAAVVMTGYTLEDLTGHAYQFPDGYSLAAGASVNVRTGVKPASFGGWWADPSKNLYWGRSNHQYGNAADSVTLQDASGARLDRVAWNDFTIRP